VRIEDFYSRSGKISDDRYHEELKNLQFSLLLLQQAYFRQKRRGIVVFEGWDAAGKGGTIKRMVEGMDPRGFRVHQIGAPTPEEQGRHYLYRFWMNLPKSGRLAIFDRSWYGRVLVERVEKLTAPERVRAAYEEINRFEQSLIDDGVSICKIFLDITKKEQVHRMKKRYNDPEKCWKLTVDDFRNLELRDAYSKSIVDMLKLTSSKHAPWHVFDANDKQTARIEVLRKVVKVLGKDVNLALPAPDPEIRRLAKVFFK
jgi:polyphosphate kinase 2 (PPK2 family)